MTPPPAAVLLASTRTASRPARPRPVRAPRADWTCDNCARCNPGRRRRCADCGTSAV